MANAGLAGASGGNFGAVVKAITGSPTATPKVGEIWPRGSKTAAG